MRTGAEREKRDLFAAPDPSSNDGFVKQTLLPPPSFGFNGAAGVGARNENSVLFRVDQLSSAAGTARLKTPAPSPAPRLDAPSSGSGSGSGGGGGDEGVIDLKALSSAPPALRPVPMIVAPLFSEPPPVSLDVGDSQHRGAGAKPKNKMFLIGGIAAAAAFLLLTGFGVAMAFKTEEPVQRTAAVAVAPPPPPPAATPAPAPEPPPPATAEDDHKETKSKKGKKGGKGKAAKGGVASGGANASSPPKVKAADPCGCKGVFNCILACTAKGGK